jgi:hypothetical protein
MPAVIGMKFVLGSDITLRKRTSAQMRATEPAFQDSPPPACQAMSDTDDPPFAFDDIMPTPP